ncbi:hypothetical protein L5F43_03840 [Aliarcobacter butzleri]|uniref:HNH endonuclease n=2 Tax=Aliarcobacter butzleri TaxID=28197 RepID=A0AAW7PUQ5_9BACT|nr:MULTISPECIES: hypothetical protein [Arcobacteraceae]MCG3684453.1 hypothetical protein [Aliarcobacter butzleri]MCG3685920.1 hypothetical protein [Aliarcobacter butzleri]MCG3705613.1 hypothetical protein [Aliarcobacter butzleri]MCT7555590.1 hypothetical protein [Aliarcobacter butzleri]MCT7591526.1 hypothetical protein [Aliarcobacter butzleri]
MNKIQTNIFDFIEDVKLVNIDYSNIPNIEIDELLSQIQDLINKKVLERTDKYFRLCLSFKPYVIKSEFSETYMLMALAWSDSAIYNYIFENGGNKLSTEKYLNICDSNGAYTKRAWEVFNEDRSLTPKDLMKKFDIKGHIRPISYANGSKEDCERALNVLIEWNINHIKSLSELQADNKYNFIRIHRRKGEIESTRCMNGECIGGIMTREVAF